MPAPRRLVAIALLAAALAGCGHLSPNWTIGDHTAARTGDDSVGIDPGEDGLAPGWSPAAGRYCVPTQTAAPDPRGVRPPEERNQRPFAFRPGLGARLRIGYWTTSIFEGGAALPPVNLGIDLVLRKVEKGSRLASAEKAVLATFLATNRRNSEANGTATNRQSLAAANAVAAREAELWNALVETLCVYVTTEQNSQPARRVWAAGADITHLCESFEDNNDGRGAFALIFMGVGDGRAMAARACHDADSPPQGEVHLGHRFASLVGASSSSTSEISSPYQLAAGVRTQQLSQPFYSPNQEVRVGALGDVIMQRPHFLSPGTEDWSLLDWEASGICVDRRGREWATRISSVLFGLDHYRIVANPAAASHQVSRVLGQGYGYAIRRRPGADHAGVPSLARADLAYLTPRDVSSTLWRADLGTRSVWSRPTCSTRG